MTRDLSPALVAALDAVRVQTDPPTARVGDREVTAQDRKGLTARLTDVLYDVLHAGRAEPPPVIRNRRDLGFERSLISVHPHRTSRVAVTLAPAGADEEHRILRINGVRVTVPAKDLKLDGEVAGTGESWALLPAARPGLSPGYLLVDGSHGNGARSGTCIRVYVHITGSEYAAQIWGAVLARLEAAQVRYRAKVTSARRMYPRRDALVVYLPPDSWAAVPVVAAAVAGLPGVGSETSIFADRLVPGVAWAFEPDDDRPGRRGASFGEHRSRAVATGLVDAAFTADGTDRYEAVAAALRAARVDPSATHRNEGPSETPFAATPEGTGVLAPA